MIDLDRHAERWVIEHRVGWLDDIFVWLSRIGAFGWIFLAVAALAALVLRRPQILLLTLCAAGAAELVTTALKYAVDRPRPHFGLAVPPPLVAVPSNPSFPSGHAALGFACAVTLAFAAPKLAVPLIALACAVAYSRLYLGVHYPLDVIAGAALGVAVAIALRVLARSLRRSRQSRQPG